MNNSKEELNKLRGKTEASFNRTSQLLRALTQIEATLSRSFISNLEFLFTSVKNEL